MHRWAQGLLMESKTWDTLRYGLGIALIFGITASMAGFEVAAWFTACGVIGYMNDLYVFRSFLSFIRREKINKRTTFFALFSVLATAIIVWFGYGLVIALTSVCFVAIDALVLRFK